MRNVLFLFFLLPFFVYQCSQTDTNPITSVEDSKSVTISIATMEGFDTIAKYAIATVTGKDMDPLNTDLTITHNSITGTIRNIPVGMARFFEVTVYDNKKVPIYYGSAYADIKLGQITYVTITLQKLSGGTAVINGTIEDNTIPCKSIYIQGIKFSTAYLDSMNKILHVVLNTEAKTSNGDPVEFSWTIYGIDEIITQIKWSKDANHLKLKFPVNGKVQVIAYARCATHTKVMTSDTLNLIIKNGVITEQTTSGNECTSIAITKLNIGSTEIISGEQVNVRMSVNADIPSKDPIQYQWYVSTAAGSDLKFNWSEKNQSISFNVPLSGYGKGMVSARCAKHPDILTNQSFSFTFDNGKLVDFYSTIKGSSGELSTIIK